MTKFIRLTTIDDLKEFMQLTAQSDYDIGVHTEKNQIADAKSILGLMAIDYSQPVRVVTDDEKFLKKLDKWAVDAQ